MSTLAETLRARRTKQADVTEDIAGMVASTAVDKTVNQILSMMPERERLTPEAIENVRTEVRRSLERKQRQMAAQQYRESRSVNTPITPVELGAALVPTTALAYGIPRLANKLRPPPAGAPAPEMPTLGGAVKSTFGPGVLPLTGAFEGVGLLMNPMSDPLYKSKRRGYFKSLQEGWRGATEQFGRRQRETREQYGLAGVPLQVLHGILNPITGVSYAGTQLYDRLTSKEGSALLKQASAVVRAELTA